MLKRLAIIAIVVAAIPIHGEQEGRKSDANQKQTNSAASPSPSAKIQCTVEQEGTTIKCEYAEAGAKSYFDRFTSAENLPNLLLVVVGLGGIGVGFFTLKWLKVQTIATKKTAKAALAQIDMIKSKERAQIAVEILPIETLEFGIGNNRAMLKIHNYGFTHAKNVQASGDARAILFEDKMVFKGIMRRRITLGRSPKEPLIEPLPMEWEDLAVPSVLLADSIYSETWVAFIFPEEWEDQISLRPNIRIEAEGSVEYDDVFGDHHFTKFSYHMWIPKFGEISREGSAPIRPYSPMSRWVKTENGNEAN